MEGGRSLTTYYYDSLNNRIRTAAVRGGQSQTYEFVFDVAGRRMSTWGAGNQAFAGLTIYSDSGPVAARWGDALLFEHTNWLGTKRMVTDWTGANVEQITSLPFDDGRATTGSDADWYDFAGLDDDTEDGTEHAQFRNYSPAQGRWLSPDPYLGSYDATDPQSFNRYAYALNNPVSLVDRSGLAPCDPSESPIPCPAPVNCAQDPQAPNCQPPAGCVYLFNAQGQPEGTVCYGTSGPPPNPVNPTGPGSGNPGTGGGTDSLSKHYGITIPCTSSAADVMDFVQTSFGTFGDYSRWGGVESVTFAPPEGMGVGSTVPISVETFGIFQNLSVNVAAMDSQSMTFTTNPGHLLYPASITFSATPAAQGSINFNINLGGTIANSFEFNLGGGNFEDAQWNNFLGQVGSYCKQQ